MLPVRRECGVGPADVDLTGAVVGTVVWIVAGCYLNIDFVAVGSDYSTEMIRAAVDADVATDAAEHLVDRDT